MTLLRGRFARGLPAHPPPPWHAELARAAGETFVLCVLAIGGVGLLLTVVWFVIHGIE
jgi:hypothetical protein